MTDVHSDLRSFRGGAWGVPVRIAGWSFRQGHSGLKRGDRIEDRPNGADQSLRE